MKKVKNAVLVIDQKNLLWRLRFAVTFSGKIIYEREVMVADGIVVHRRKIDKKPPDCCEFPKENGIFLCSCGKHLAYIHDTDEHGMLRQIVELPESLFKFSP